MRWFFVFLIHFAVTAPCLAANFTTERLRHIAVAVKLNVPDTLKPDSEYDNICTYKGRKLTVKTNAWGEINNIGYQMFSNEIRTASGYDPVLDFMQRYLLEWDLNIDGRIQLPQMYKDEVTFTRGSIEQLKAVTQQTPFSINELKRRAYKLRWTLGRKEVEVSVNADAQLFIGGNAIDLETMMIRGLGRIQSDVYTLSPEETDLSKISKADDDNYIVKGSSYLSDAIRNDLYFVQIHGKKELLCSSKNAAKSISNIMLTGTFRHLLPMRVIFDKYGYKQETLDITLQQFISYCKSEHCQLFFGVKKIKDGILYGTLFALNDKMAFNHVLAVEFPLSVISGENVLIKAKAFAYIPLQNVTERFFTKDITNEYEKRK